MNKPNPKVEFFFTKEKRWPEEIKKMRAIALDSGLSEELKWGCPCYVLEENNIILIHTFKEYCAFLFFKGALLKDPKRILIQQTQNVQAARQIRFTSVKEVINKKSILKSYINEAIKVEKSGLKVKFKKTAEFNMPEEFRKQLSKNSALKTAFEALTPGRQRGYLLYFSAAKQSQTREDRIEKCTGKILDGVGLND